MTFRLPVPRLVPADAEVLERRARALASGGDREDAAAAGMMRLVSFRLRGAPCAVEADVVERALVLAAPIPVPLADGSERPVAFVEEHPLPVADLAGTAAGAPRRAAELAGSPALVVATPEGSVAVAVEGPLELVEDRLAAALWHAQETAEVRLAGRLAGGAVLVEAAWLVRWAGKAARP